MKAIYTQVGNAMKSIFIIILTISFLQSPGQDIFRPSGLDSITAASGDLDKDGIKEKAIVYNTKDTTDEGTVRELWIFRKTQGKWQVWLKSRNAILKSQEGGMMGDPFGELIIKNGILHISFEGGSSWKWNYTDKYRFQKNTLQLIGHTSFYGKPCEYWQQFDYNISTGKIVYRREFENCDNGQKTIKTETETFITKPISFNIQNRYPSNIKISTPKLKVTLYL
jgi:hypothetical protein